jgi:hypothetical protein
MKGKDSFLMSGGLMNRILFILAFFCSCIWPCLDAMEQATASQAVTPKTAESPTIREELSGSSHRHSGSVRLSVTLSDLQAIARQASPEDPGNRTERRKSARSSVRIQPVEMQAIGQTETVAAAPSPTTATEPPRDVVIQIDVPDLSKASFDELASIVDDLIRQAGVATFGADEENPFYMQELKTHILHAFLEYIHSNGKSDSSSSSSSSSEKGSRASSPHEDQIIALRNSVFQRVNSQRLVKIPQRSPDEASTSRQSPVRVDKETRKELKQWFLRELELHDLRRKEQERQLQDKVSEEERKIIAEQKKTKYAILATLTTTICGITSTVVTYFLTQAGQASE